VRREYGKLAGVSSVDTLLNGAVVKLKSGNTVSLERLWRIADKLLTEPVEARVVVAGRLVENATGFQLELASKGRAYQLKANPKQVEELHLLAGQNVLADALMTVLSETNTEVRLRKIALDSAPR
jgi:hypothetical protein